MDSNLQILLIIVNACAGLGLALAYLLRRVGDTSVSKVKVEQTKADEEIDKTKALANQSAQLLDLFKSQLLINEETRKEREATYKMFTDAQVAGEANYKTLKAIVEDGTQFLHNALIKEVRGLMTALSSANQANFKLMGAEIGAAIANELSLRDGQDLYPFPEFDDPTWKEAMIAPKADKVCIYKRPLDHEAFVVKSAAGCFDKPEKVKMADRPGNFYAIFRYTNNLWGWVLKSEVTTEIPQLQILAG